MILYPIMLKEDTLKYGYRFFSSSSSVSGQIRGLFAEGVLCSSCIGNWTNRSSSGFLFVYFSSLNSNVELHNSTLLYWSRTEINNTVYDRILGGLNYHHTRDNKNEDTTSSF